MSDTENQEDIYSDGGFPQIKICMKDDAIVIEEKTKREFNSKNVMSIQSILNKRRSTPFLNMPKRLTKAQSENSDSDSPIKFNKKYDLQKSLHDISNLDVSKLI